ncbi:MAG: (Fe-S)-binding protein [Alphaproteobacteria bacterium]|nr:(Fe-S)-binding protein [Alphaproteobacteria bacterium]
MSNLSPHIGLLVTCLVDAMRPEIGFATLKLLEQAGCRVSVPETQTCCGQPALNSGARAEAQALAKRVVAAFEPFDYVVAPSGSCLGTVKTHYPELLADDPVWRKRAEQVAAKSFEILSFLADVRGWQPEGVRFPAKATYHHTCAGLRELGIYDQPLRLLAAVEGLELVPLAGENACCGFGGTFAVKYPEISTAIVSDKTRQIAATGADTLLAADLGCLMNIAGKLSREGRGDIRVFHPVEILAGMADGKGVAGR